jgi:squalene synthase HpnC
MLKNRGRAHTTADREGHRSSAYNRSVTPPVHGVEHYENFPVASWLMPVRLRPAVIDIYRFARHADDLADEGDAQTSARRAALAALSRDIDRAEQGLSCDCAQVAALVRHVREHQLGWQPFRDLLSAFDQDLDTLRYADFDTLLDYCRRSADPIGRLILTLASRLDARTAPLSDAICTSLQLINFLQDAASDWRRGRLYLPSTTLQQHGVREADVARAVQIGRADGGLRACIAYEASRAGQMLAEGSPLPSQVKGRMGWELRAIVAGGQRILDKLAHHGHDPFAQRPKLGRADALPIAGIMARLAVRGALPRPDPTDIAPT